MELTNLLGFTLPAPLPGRSGQKKDTSELELNCFRRRAPEGRITRTDPLSHARTLPRESERKGKAQTERRQSASGCGCGVLLKLRETSTCRTCRASPKRKRRSVVGRRS